MLGGTSNGNAVRHAAFLRGINVGGRRVTGAQLCAPLEELGFRDVASFLASGNVVLDADDVDGLEERIGAALTAALGFPVEAFVRSAAEVSEVVAREPFPAEVVAAGDGKPQVTFLRASPDPVAVAEVLALATDEDRLAVGGREWYWLPSRGISKSRLDIRAIERALGVGTTRTLNTVVRLHAKLRSDASA